MKVRVGSLFAGIGGICTGFEQAGCEVVWANEFNSEACKTYRLNYPNTSVIEMDIDTWIKDAVYPRCTIEPIDILTSGFPCQAFSIAGYRQGFNDEKGRGNLFFSTAKIISALQPKAFLLENVKNLASHDSGNTIKVIEETIRKELNYSFIPFILNSKEYGDIPQTRERIYIVGFRGEGAYANDDAQKIEGIRTHQFRIPQPIPLTKTIHDILSQEKQEDRFYYKPEHQYYSALSESMQNENTVYQWRRVYVRENKSSVCPTLTANMGTGGHNVPLIRDRFGIRKLTPEECVRFQGFPTSFKFPEKMAVSHRYKQAGNSVVVPVIKRIAENMIAALDQQFGSRMGMPVKPHFHTQKQAANLIERC